MIIDMFVHILPPKYRAALLKENMTNHYKVLLNRRPALDVEKEAQIMDKIGGVMRVPTVSGPPLEDVASPKRAAELARIANDELAELVSKYPNRFPAAVAWLPMNNMEAALIETDRAIKELKLKGIQIYTPITDKPLDSPEFLPLYAKMAQYDLPIWIHPTRPVDYPDYRTEKESKYYIYTELGWIYETSAAMSRLVMSGVLEKHPNLKFITHHAGGMIPSMATRVARLKGGEGLSKPLIDYFKKFYADTNLGDNTAALMCAHAFFGADHLVVGTDFPSEEGTRDKVAAIERMAISNAEKKMILEDNARRLLHLNR